MALATMLQLGSVRSWEVPCILSMLDTPLGCCNTVGCPNGQNGRPKAKLLKCKRHSQSRPGIFGLEVLDASTNEAARPRRIPLRLSSRPNAKRAFVFQERSVSSAADRQAEAKAGEVQATQLQQAGSRFGFALDV